MLFKETVDARTLEIIKELMADDVLKDFNLAGGTALSLQIGHRKSIDIDLFSQKDFDSEAFQQHLQKKYDADIMVVDNNSVKVYIEDIRVDLTSHQYPLVKPVQTIEGIRMLSIEDIAAMKFNAITREATRIKDFIDVYAILEKKSLNQLTMAYLDKYPNVNAYMGQQSLLFQSEIDFSKAGNLLEIFNWNKVTQRLQEAVNEPNRIFLKDQKKSLKRSKGRRI